MQYNESYASKFSTLRGRLNCKVNRNYLDTRLVLKSEVRREDLQNKVSQNLNFNF